MRQILIAIQVVGILAQFDTPLLPIPKIPLQSKIAVACDECRMWQNVLDCSDRGNATIPDVVSTDIVDTLLLANNRFRSISSSLFPNWTPTKLVNLDLSKNLLREIPDGIFNHFAKLQYIDLSHNLFVKKPSLGSLSGRLRGLSLRSNRLHSDQDNFTGMNLLSDLYLDYNALNDTRQLGSLPSLRTLTLNSNKIRLPTFEVKSQFPLIDYVDIRNNLIYVLAFMNSTTLKTLRFGSGGWKSVIVNLNSVPNLENLELTNFTFTHRFPGEALAAQSNLKALKLIDGRDVQNLALPPNAESVWLENLPVVRILNTPSTLINFTVINCRNLVEPFGRNLTIDRKFQIKNVHISRSALAAKRGAGICLTETICPFLTPSFSKTVSHVDLSHNNISTINHFFFVTTQNIKSIDLSYNKLTTILSFEMYGMNPLTLKVLDWSHNQLREIPPPLEKYTALKTFNLQGNDLVVLPSVGAELFPSLRQLNLSGNNLQKASSLLAVTSPSLRVDISFNPWNCDAGSEVVRKNVRLLLQCDLAFRIKNESACLCPADSSKPKYAPPKLSKVTCISSEPRVSSSASPLTISASSKIFRKEKFLTAKNTLQSTKTPRDRTRKAKNENRVNMYIGLAVGCGAGAVLIVLASVFLYRAYRPKNVSLGLPGGIELNE